MTQTPASGPFTLVTLPPRSPGPILMSGSVNWAGSPAGQAARSTTKPTDIIPPDQRVIRTSFAGLVNDRAAEHGRVPRARRAQLTAALGEHRVHAVPRSDLEAHRGALESVRAKAPSFASTSRPASMSSREPNAIM